MTNIDQTTKQHNEISETVNIETGEGITWFKVDGQIWTYPTDYWYGRESRNCDWRVTVTELIEENISGFEVGDTLEIDGFIRDIKPGDLILDIEREVSVIRRVNNLECAGGPERGAILCKTDFVDFNPSEFTGPCELAGKVVTLIRNLDQVDAK